MFILSFLLGLMELAMFGAGVMYFLVEYRRGFSQTRYLFEQACSFAQDFFHLQVDPKKRTEAVVSRFSKSLGVLREAVATLQANYEVAAHQVAEQGKLVQDFRELEEQNLRSGDEDTALAAATAAVQAEKRMALYRETAQSQIQAATELQEELDREEPHYDTIQTQAETIHVNSAIAEARQSLYELLSDVQAQTGLTARGTLKQLVEASEKDRIKSGKLLEMVRRSSSSKMRDMIGDSEVRRELEATRQRMSLPEGRPSSNGQVKILAVDDAVDISADM